MVDSSEVITTTGTLCVMSQFSNGVYQFTTTAPTRAAADEYLSQIEALFRDNTNVPLLRFLIDTTVAVVPLNYVMPGYKNLQTKYPNRPQVCMAVISSNNWIALMSGFANALRIQQMSRFFKPGQRDEAMAWLLDNK